ncbi:MAG: sugar phosphate isomerase/epimerase family protein [Deltaproteobacteria bacterium]|nr:sugar phosphate isomerase/epimerase family protein [Deltaproteobacteria bacterium]
MNKHAKSPSSPGAHPSWSFGAGLWMFGQFVDRYASDAYGPPVSTVEAIDRAGRVGSLSVLDINYPFSEASIDVPEVKAALERNHLRAWAVTPHIYTREFQKGAFTNPDPSVRKGAIELCKEAIEVARGLGAKYVKFWPGQDGFDYPFQADYGELWDLTVAGIKEVASADPNMQFAIEYKFKEPRTHMTLSTAARTLLAIEEAGLPNVGIVMDLGHSLFAQETPAEVVELVHRRKRLTSVELNDNWRQWDDDLTVGAVHLVETLEYLWALRKINWQGPLLLDQFPFREDSVAAAQQSIATIKALVRTLDKIDGETLRAAQRKQDALAAQRLVQKLFLQEFDLADGGRK